MTAMIISVGGEPKAIIASLLNHRPEQVCFFASQQSVDLIGGIKQSLKEKGLTFIDYKVICDDPDDLVHCYERALRCVDHVFEAGYASESVVVDYTGGTKNMSVSLALAAVGKGCCFSYVGGKARTKNGLGVVMTGQEIVHKGQNPWDLYAVEEKKRLAQFVNHFMYNAALAVIADARGRLVAPMAKAWELLEQTIEAYLAWDHFNHKAAYRTLKKVLDGLELLESVGGGLPSAFISQVRNSFETLSDIKDKTGDFKRLDSILVLDIVSNAARRQSQGKYDDAVARLYRALEMAGQVEFEAVFGCSTSEVIPELLPESIREDFTIRYGSQEGPNLKLPLFATFSALKETGNPTAVEFFKLEADLKKVLFERNNSILAHGISPVTGETCEKLFGIVKDLFVPGDLINFPELHW